MARRLGGTAERYGLEPELVPSPGGLYLHAALRGTGGARVALLCHHDTVYPLGTAASRPFRRDERPVPRARGRRHEGRCRGRAPRRAGARGRAATVRARRGRVGSGRGVAARPARDARPAGDVRRRPLPRVRPPSRRGRVGAQGRGVAAGTRGGPRRPRRGGAAGGPQRGPGARARGAPPGRAGRGPRGHDAADHGARGRRRTEHRAEPGLPGSGRAGGDAGATSTGRRAGSPTFPGYDGITLRYEDLGGPPPFERTPAVGRLAETAIAIGGTLGHEFGEAVAGGVSDGSWTASHGIPTLDGLGPVGGDDHSPAEYVETASFAPRCGVVAGLVAAIDAGLLAG